MPLNKSEAQYKNEVHLAGNLAKDPIIRYTPNGKCVANLTIVTKYEQHSEFHRVVTWEQLAERVAMFKKGQFVKAVGRLQTRSWEDKQSGQKKYLTEIVVFQLVIPADDPPPLTPDAISGGTAAARAILSPTKKNIHGQEITDDDIPF
jgi:single-strand DNA-binding protein